MYSLIKQLPVSAKRQAKFVLAGMAVFACVLIPGALWYKSSVSSMSRSSVAEQLSLLRMRILTLKQQLTSEAAVVYDTIVRLPLSKGVKKIDRDLPFDLLVLFDDERKVIDGFRSLSTKNLRVDLPTDAAKKMVQVDSSFFDQMSPQGFSSGMIVVESRPMLIAVRMVDLPSKPNGGFVVFGRWLDVRRLAITGEQAEQRMELFHIAQEDRLPQDVRAAISVAQRGNGSTYQLDRTGSGYIYSLLEDLSSRPVVLVKMPWNMPWHDTGVLGFQLFYMVSFLAGIGTWAFLFTLDRKNRSRVRQFDGLSSLRDDHIKNFVESFPGYAFALRSNFQYVGVSRLLSGVTGQESSNYTQKKFGSVANEWNDGTLERVFERLKDPNTWPRVASINHVIEGLGERHLFQGTAHYLVKQDMLLVILSQKSNISALTGPRPKEEQRAKAAPQDQEEKVA